MNMKSVAQLGIALAFVTNLALADDKTVTAPSTPENKVVEKAQEKVAEDRKQLKEDKAALKSARKERRHKRHEAKKEAVGSQPSSVVEPAVTK